MCLNQGLAAPVRPVVSGLADAVRAFPATRPTDRMYACRATPVNPQNHYILWYPALRNHHI